MFDANKYKPTVIFCDMFVVPNRISRNKIQVWLTNNEVDNLQDHCHTIKKGGEEYTGYIVEKIIPYNEETMVEGNLVKMRLTFRGRKKNGEILEKKNVEFPVTVEALCKQSKYRYKRFGNFEDAALYATSC